jgi:hypothetical protein
MAGFFSGLTRGIWTFVILSFAAVFLVAATDDPRAWQLLTVRGFSAIAVTSLVIGWLIRARKQPGSDLSAAKTSGRRKKRREPARSEPAPRETQVVARREPTLTTNQARAETPPQRIDPATDFETAALLEAGPEPEDDTQDETVVASQGARIRVPPPTGDGNVDRCFDIQGLDDRPETRNWQELPRLVEARRLRLSEDRDTAIARLGEIRTQFPDFENVYVWSAEAMDRAGRGEERDALLIEGLAAARSKAGILAALGSYAAEDGRLDDAVEWLVRSAALQMGGGAETGPFAFLELAALSEPHRRLSKALVWLYEQADRLDPRNTRLADDFLEERRALSQEKAEPWMLEAIGRLWEFYGSEDAPTELPSPRQTSRNSPLRAERHRRPQALR